MDIDLSIRIHLNICGLLLLIKNNMSKINDSVFSFLQKNMQSIFRFEKYPKKMYNLFAFVSARRSELIFFCFLISMAKLLLIVFKSCVYVCGRLQVGKDEEQRTQKKKQAFIFILFKICYIINVAYYRV